MKKKAAKRGRPSRKDLGLEPTVQITAKVEQSVRDTLIERFGTIPEALRYLAKRTKT